MTRDKTTIKCDFDSICVQNKIYIFNVDNLKKTKHLYIVNMCQRNTEKHLNWVLIVMLFQAITKALCKQMVQVDCQIRTQVIFIMKCAQNTFTWIVESSLT